MAGCLYCLMHKNIPVVDFILDQTTGVIKTIGTVHNANHLPVGISMKHDVVNRGELNNWWIGRSIPASRDKIQDALQELGVSSPPLLLERCLGLSLSDHYWIRRANDRVQWEQVNFFQNKFSCDVGHILFGGNSNGYVNCMSPDNTSDGWLKKRWLILDGKRCLLKGGSGTVQQEPYNEVLASMIMSRLKIPHVPYTLTIQEDYPYSLCEDFVSTDTELIPAWYLMQTRKKQNHESVFQHYMNCCQSLDIPNMQMAIDQMIVLDYLIVNEDRHQNNFGVLRNPDTLKYLGPAPIYDSGTSLWFSKPTPMIGSQHVTCKPFKSKHDEQIKLVSSFDWIDLSKLNGIEDEWMALTDHSLFLDEARRVAIAKALRAQIERLAAVMCHHEKHQSDDLSFDVRTDEKYSGSPK